MAQLTDQERKIVKGIFDKMEYEKIGPQALKRCLIVYPWCLRYFGEDAYGDTSSPEAIMANPKIAAHGIKVLHGLDMALENMDNIKAAYAKLSILHSEKLHVDPSNFRFFADILTIELAIKMKERYFTEYVQCALQKFLNLVVSALSRQYH